jgi:hypothetical protein
MEKDGISVQDRIKLFDISDQLFDMFHFRHFG